jgi:DNA-binding LacI/PurR family transcriptional regulator
MPVVLPGRFPHLPQAVRDRRDGFQAAAAKHGAEGIVIEGDFSKNWVAAIEKLGRPRASKWLFAATTNGTWRS